MTQKAKFQLNPAANEQFAAIKKDLQRITKFNGYNLDNSNELIFICRLSNLKNQVEKSFSLEKLHII
ncbi:17932_t:CDS:2 [Dentiscutata erythropus]|uniref:17932_t:CDS:1 n=1 Tax=Dentiscutata erythropus TaxID=1348616 RepID=A0A9N8WPT4_9GLOM|nr:17932_t:CDS:2 [Dentiscutata erythropus]